MLGSTEEPWDVLPKRRCGSSNCRKQVTASSSNGAGTPSAAVPTQSPTYSMTTTSSSSSSASATSTAVTSGSSTSNAAIIAGSVIGGVVLLALVVLASIVYLRIRKRRRTPPSSEFINSLRAGVTPILRLDSGAEYTPTLPEKGGGYSHSPKSAYYTAVPMQKMRSPDEMMLTDIPSAQLTVEKPLHPQRLSAQEASDPLGAQHRPSTSVGSRRGLWGNETEVVSSELSPVHRSPPRSTESVLHFAPRFSLDERREPSPQPSYHSPTFHPLRRQQTGSEDIIIE